MGRYYYPNASDALDAKKQFLREHHYKIKHCFKNTWGTGFVLFDTKEEVNQWYKENSGAYFYKEEYEPGTTFTKADAIKEIESAYGSAIDNILNNRSYSCPILAIGLPSKTAFGNRLLLKFVSSTNEEDIEYRFYIHYCPEFINVKPSTSNSTIRQSIINKLYIYFYDSRFKTRINGSQEYHRQIKIDPVDMPFYRTISNTVPPKASPSYTPPPRQSTSYQNNNSGSLDRATIEAGCGIVGFIGIGAGMIGGFAFGLPGGIVGYIAGTIAAIYIFSNMDK